MRSARIAGLVVALSLAVTGIGSSQTADTPVQLKDVSIDRASDGASVTVKTSGPAQYEAKLIDTPTRLVIDVSGATYNSAKSRWTSGVEPVKEVRGSQWRKGIARIVVEMTRNDVAYHIDETADGLVVAVESKTETSKLNNAHARHGQDRRQADARRGRQGGREDAGGGADQRRHRDGCPQGREADRDRRRQAGRQGRLPLRRP